MPAHISVADVFITAELDRRPAGTADYLREKVALQDLAREMAERPGGVLPRLVALAMELCGAQSAGISLHEAEAAQFRWHHLHGTLKQFEGATTPGNFSPCGVCLDEKRAVLSEHPERVYSWIADANIVVPEVLLVPLYGQQSKPLGTLWVIAQEKGQFHSGHARTMTELAAFAGLAFHMVGAERRLTSALEESRTLADEMNHRIKNLFAIASGLVSLSAREAQTPQDMAASLSGRLNALARAHAIVHKSFGDAQNTISGDLGTMVVAVLQPYEARQGNRIEGPAVMLTERAISSIALVLHELATNAAKYGALKEGQGRVDVSWSIGGGEMLTLTWRETGGARVSAPPQQNGFGAEIARRGVQQLEGSIAYDWPAQGVVVTIVLPLAQLALQQVA